MALNIIRQIYKELVQSGIFTGILASWHPGCGEIPKPLSLQKLFVTYPVSVKLLRINPKRQHSKKLYVTLLVILFGIMVIRELFILREKPYYVVFSFCCKTNYSNFQFLGKPEGVKNKFFHVTFMV